MKKIISLLLAVALVIGVLPVTALADDGTTWDGTTVATAFAGGTGTATDPYRIETAGQLIYFRNKVNGGSKYSGQYIRLDADLDMAGFEFGAAIGTSSKYFLGTFDGNNKTISNLSQTSKSGYAGLFGYAGYSNKSAVIKNLTLSNVNITQNYAYSYGAALCATFLNGTIENCHVTSGTVTSTCKSGVGGIVGSAGTSGTTCTIENCTNNAAINAVAKVAGIVGNANTSVAELNIIDCINTGKITATKDTSNHSYAAGILGIAPGNAAIERCANTGDVTGTGDFVGGIAADNSAGIIDNCYNWGTISGTEKVGGIAGSTSADKNMNNCYSVGIVSATNETKVGAITGYFGTSSGYDTYITNCYYLSGTADYGAYLSNGTADLNPMTPEEFADGTVAKLLQAANTEEVWGQTIGTDDYPVFYNGTNSVLAKTYSVTWLVDGEEYDKIEGLSVGDPIAVPADPAKAAAECTTYTFDGWDAEIPEAMPAENLVFNAVFSETVNHELEYQDNGDGTHSASCACGQETIENEEHDYTHTPDHCICGAEKPQQEELPGFSATLTLNETIDINFIISNKVTDLTGFTYEVRNLTRNETVSYTLIKRDDGRTAIRVRANADQMTDEFSVQVFDANGNPVTKVGVTSIRSYALRRLDRTDVADLEKATLVRMLEYGALAQKISKYRQDDLATSVLTDTHRAYANAIQWAEPVAEPDYGSSNGSFTASVTLNQSIDLNLYTKETVDMTGKHFVVKLGDEVLAESRYSVTPNGDGRTRLRYSVNSDRMYEGITVMLVNENDEVVDQIFIHVCRYAHMRLRNATVDATEKAILVAMLDYGALAQMLSGNATDDLANKHLTADQRKLLTEYDWSIPEN